MWRGVGWLLHSSDLILRQGKSGLPLVLLGRLVWVRGGTAVPLPFAFHSVGLSGPGVAESPSPDRGKQTGWARHAVGGVPDCTRSVGGCTCVWVPRTHGSQLARLEESLLTTRSSKLRGVGRSGKQYSLSFGDVIIFEAFSLQGWVKGLKGRMNVRRYLQLSCLCVPCLQGVDTVLLCRVAEADCFGS